MSSDSQNRAAPGRVFAHAGQPFLERAYDVVVVGGGRLGLTTAFYLRRFCPEARVLVVERGGIPSEDGAALQARGVWHGAGLPEAWCARARWVRRVWADPAAETGTLRPHDPPFRAVGWAQLQGQEPQGQEPPQEGLQLRDPSAFVSDLPGPAREQLLALADLAGVEGILFDPAGGHGSAAALALSFGYGAVRLGADLLLNTEARLQAGSVELRRLDITREMRVVVAETVAVRAGQLVVAAGAAGPALLEADLGLVCPHGQAYAQFPRFKVAPAPGLPVLMGGGMTLRPGEGDFRILPPVRGADPAGYTPQGGRLVGVPVGVRREVLDDLLLALPRWPALGRAGLDLGKAPSDVPGVWEARPRGGWPLWERADSQVTLLLGGPESDRTGLAVALDLAATLSGVQARPWAQV